MRAVFVSRVVGACLICVPFAAVGAQEPQEGDFAFDSVEVFTGDVPGVKCYVSERYVVVERERKQRLGSDLLVRAREGDHCVTDRMPGDFAIRDEWASYFSALQGDVLLIDSGSGPDVRGLIVYDLKERRRVAELSYVDLAPGPDPLSLGIWDGAELDEPLPGCPTPPGGLIPGVDSLFYVNLRTGEARFAGKTRCAHRQ